MNNHNSKVLPCFKLGACTPPPSPPPPFIYRHGYPLILNISPCIKIGSWFPPPPPSHLLNPPPPFIYQALSWTQTRVARKNNGIALKRVQTFRHVNERFRIIDVRNLNTNLITKKFMHFHMNNNNNKSSQLKTVLFSITTIHCRALVLVSQSVYCWRLYLKNITKEAVCLLENTNMRFTLMKMSKCRLRFLPYVSPLSLNDKFFNFFK